MASHRCQSYSMNIIIAIEPLICMISISVSIDGTIAIYTHAV